MDAVEAKAVNGSHLVVDDPKQAGEARFNARDIGIAKKQLEQAKSIKELKDIYVRIGDIRYHPEVTIKKDEMKAALAEQPEVVTATRGGEDE